MKSVLQVSSLTKSYSIPSQTKGSHSANERLEVLKKISFHVAPGERVAIMGRSGGGKSTLLSCLAGLDSIDSGTIEILGRDISKLPAAKLNEFRAQTIGIVFQQFQLLDHFTALENVRLPLDLAAVAPEQADARAIEKLTRVALEDRSGHFPDQMSRGECQRVAIARVLAMGCPLIFADEPTGSLDVKTGTAVMDLLFESAKEVNAALVLVTHDPVLAKRCDRILRLEDGHLLEGAAT